jgi:hypothetical protein
VFQPPTRFQRGPCKKLLSVDSQIKPGKFLILN